MNDSDLLRSYAENHSERAFAELVQRHLGLVYATALRRLNQDALAEDGTQVVFSDLARKAARLRCIAPAPRGGSSCPRVRSIASPASC